MATNTGKRNTFKISGLSSTIWVSQLFQFSIFIILSVVLFADTIRILVREWNGRADASHGWLIPIILFYLVWIKRDSIKPLLGRQRSYSILLISMGSLTLYFLGKISLVLTFERAGFILFLISSVIFIIGIPAAKKI